MLFKSASSMNSRNATRVAGGTEIVAGGGSGTTGAEIVVVVAKIVVNGPKIVADDATWLLDGEVGAGSCFLPFLAMGECWRTESPSLTL